MRTSRDIQLVRRTDEYVEFTAIKFSYMLSICLKRTGKIYFSPWSISCDKIICFFNFLKGSSTRFVILTILPKHVNTLISVPTLIYVESIRTRNEHLHNLLDRLRIRQIAFLIRMKMKRTSTVFASEIRNSSNGKRIQWSASLLCMMGKKAVEYANAFDSISHNFIYGI